MSTVILTKRQLEEAIHRTTEPVLSELVIYRVKSKAQVILESDELLRSFVYNSPPTVYRHNNAQAIQEALLLEALIQEGFREWFKNAFDAVGETFTSVKKGVTKKAVKAWKAGVSKLDLDALRMRIAKSAIKMAVNPILRGDLPKKIRSRMKAGIAGGVREGMLHEALTDEQYRAAMGALYLDKSLTPTQFRQKADELGMLTKAEGQEVGNELVDAITENIIGESVAAAAGAGAKVLPESFLGKVKMLCHMMVKSFVFGFLDNFIMVICGASLDTTIQATMGITDAATATLVAGGFGNTISDAVAEYLADAMEKKMDDKFGVPPDIPEEELAGLNIIWKVLFRNPSVVGITLGCLVGLGVGMAIMGYFGIPIMGALIGFAGILGLKVGVDKLRGKKRSDRWGSKSQEEREAEAAERARERAEKAGETETEPETVTAGFQRENDLLREYIRSTFHSINIDTK
jgi:hypothetical protein